MPRRARFLKPRLKLQFPNPTGTSIPHPRRVHCQTTTDAATGYLQPLPERPEATFPIDNHSAATSYKSRCRNHFLSPSQVFTYSSLRLYLSVTFVGEGDIR